MCAASDPPEIDSPPRESGTAPFATVYVTITKQEHIQLKSAAQQWQTLHRKAIGRSKWREQRYQRILRELKVRCAKTEAKLRAELEFAQAKIRDLQKRLFAGKSERSKSCEAKAQGAACHAHRGHQRGASGHGRTMQPHLPARDEFVEIEKPQCPRCGLALRPFPGTEDCEVLEIEVKAYRRVIHRRRYAPTCQCGALAGIITAPPPARLIKRGKFGISVWTSVLLDKYLYGRPSQRLLQDFHDHGLHMSAGTLAGGLQALAPLFEPLDKAFLAKLRTEPHWHADETRWAVFVQVDGKVPIKPRFKPAAPVRGPPSPRSWPVFQSGCLDVSRRPPHAA